MSNYQYTKANKFSRLSYVAHVGGRRFGLYRMPCNGWRAECLGPHDDEGVTGRGITRDLAVLDAIKQCDKRDRRLAGPFGEILRTNTRWA